MSCAQAYYSGQAALARDAATRARLLEAAAEETDHLAWCDERLAALHSRPSLLNPLWYQGQFRHWRGGHALASDRISLGFVVETERQVEAHLGEHLQSSEADARSRAVVAQMQADEARHGRLARQPAALICRRRCRSLMRLASAVMKAVAYRI